jgi:hypothetical protein
MPQPGWIPTQPSAFQSSPFAGSLGAAAGWEAIRLGASVKDHSQAELAYYPYMVFSIVSVLTPFFDLFNLSHIRQVEAVNTYNRDLSFRMGLELLPGNPNEGLLY